LDLIKIFKRQFAAKLPKDLSFMKKTIEHIKNRMIAGIIFIIPVFVIITIVQKIWASLNNAGSLVADKLGLKTLLGAQSVTFATALLLVGIFYILGWMVKFSLLNRFRDWIENSLLQYIPGYLSYKAKMQEKLLPKKDARQPVLVDYGTYRRPGLLIETQEDDAIVFFPNAPDSNNGQTHVVKTQQVLPLPSDAASLLKSLQACGKNLPLS
jgi:uncharacterized membrane protein